MKEGNPRKIALVGTSSVGKTETISQLNQRYSNDLDYAFVPEAARIFFTMHPEIPQSKRFTKDVQSQVQDLQINMEKMAENLGAQTIFCDRSVLDAVVYTRANGELEGSEELYEKIANWVITYSKIFLLDPADVPYVTDDIRRENESICNKNHETFLEVFKEKNIPYEVLSGTIEERVSKVEELLS